MIKNEEYEKPRLIQTGRGFSVLYRNKYLYSKYNPAQSIILQVNGLQIPDSTLVLCFSPVLGYGLRELSEKLPVSSFILAVEYDQALMRFSIDNGISALVSHQRFSYIRTASLSEAIKKIETLPLFPFKKCISLSCSGGVRFYQDFYDQVRLYADEVISRFWKNRLTLMHLGRNYAHNTFRNLLLLADSAICTEEPISADNTAAAEHCCCHLLTGEERILKPVLVAGAGPSLDGAREFIIRNRNAFFLLAVDAAAAALPPEIRPDGVILVESQYWIDSAFIGLKNQGIPLFADLTASPRAIRAAGNEVYFFCTEYARLRYLQRLYQTAHPLIMQPMGSVGLIALQLALALTDSRLPVFHTGLDFAWKSGFTHAAESSPLRKLFAETDRVESLYKLNFPTGVRPVVGKEGVAYRTTAVLIGYAELYRHVFADNGRVIDIGTEGCCLTERQSGFDEAERLLADIESDAAFSGTGCAFDFGSGEKTDRSSEVRCAIRAYIEQEREALTALAGHLQGKGMLPAEIFERMIAERDYLYGHFPDAARGYSLESGFLKRISIELAYLLKMLS